MSLLIDVSGVLRKHYTIESFYDRKLWFLLWCLSLFLSLNSCFFTVYFRYILECDILWMYLFLPYCVRKWHNKTVQSINILFVVLRKSSVPSEIHDDVIKWKNFPRNWPFVQGIHRSPVNSLHKGQWRGALMFSLICVWINDWVNNREAGDLRRYCAHYDVIVMNMMTPWGKGFWHE